MYTAVIMLYTPGFIVRAVC